MGIGTQWESMGAQWEPMGAQCWEWEHNAENGSTSNGNVGAVILGMGAQCCWEWDTMDIGLGNRNPTATQPQLNRRPAAAQPQPNRNSTQDNNPGG